MLRLVVHGERAGQWDLLNLLDIADQRTLSRLFVRGGIESFLEASAPPTLDSFLTTQRFVRDNDLLLHLRCALEDSPAGVLDGHKSERAELVRSSDSPSR